MQKPPDDRPLHELLHVALTMTRGMEQNGDILREVLHDLAVAINKTLDQQAVIMREFAKMDALDRRIIHNELVIRALKEQLASGSP
jgi:hypothetical protein